MWNFRDLLEEREKKGQTRLFTEFKTLQEKLRQRYLQAASPDRGVYVGVPHCEAVEEHINRMVPDDLKQRFSSTEIFFLLAAI
jgi:hypothetical protein